MVENLKSVYQSLSQSFQHLNDAIEKSEGLDGKLKNRLSSMLMDFNALFEYMLNETSEQEIADVSHSKEIPVPNHSFGDIVRDRRNKMGLSQEALAEVVGVSQQSIDQYETNRMNPPVKIYKKLLFVLGLTPSGLLDQEPYPRTNAAFVKELIHLLDELEDRL